jgi:hypothetical protein
MVDKVEVDDIEAGVRVAESAACCLVSCMFSLQLRLRDFLNFIFCI